MIRKILQPKTNQLSIPEPCRILITGITSIHGWPIYKKLVSDIPAERLFGIRPPKMNIPDDENVKSVCITEIEELKRIRETFQPTHIIHGAGVCDLDVCEDRPHWARTLNAGGAKAVTEVFGECANIIYLSSDLVFSGNNPPENGYTEDCATDPVSVVGKTIFQSEQEIRKSKRWCIVRLGLPIGESITKTKGAVDWIEGRFKRKLPVTLFYDECRSCILCDDISEIIFLIIQKEICGLYHLGGKDVLSLFDIGELVLKNGNYSPDLLKSISRFEEKNGPPRIGNVALNSQKLMRAVLNSGEICVGS